LNHGEDLTYQLIALHPCNGIQQMLIQWNFLMEILGQMYKIIRNGLFHLQVKLEYIVQLIWIDNPANLTEEAVPFATRILSFIKRLAVLLVDMTPAQLKKPCFWLIFLMNETKKSEKWIVLTFNIWLRIFCQLFIDNYLCCICIKLNILVQF